MNDKYDVKNDNEGLYQKYAERQANKLLENKSRQPAHKGFVDILELLKPRDVKHSSWVPKDIRGASTRVNVGNGLVLKWLETDTVDAEKAWHQIFNRFCDLDIANKYIDSENEKDVDSILMAFTRYMSHLSFESDRPIHQSLKIPEYERQKKIDSLEAATRKTMSLSRELSVDNENTLDSKAKDLANTVEWANDIIGLSVCDLLWDILKENLPEQQNLKDNIFNAFENAIEGEHGIRLAAKIVVSSRDLNIINVLQHHLDKLDYLKSARSLTSPNSDSARQIHFAKNWLVVMYELFGEPLWEASATVASIYLDEIITADQFRDTCRKAEGGKLIERCRLRVKRED